MMYGNVIGQVITIASIPILSRLFSPSDFGVYSIVFTTISIFGYIACMGFDNAIILPDSNSKAFTLLKMGVVLTVIFSMVLLLISFVLPEKFYYFIGQQTLYKYSWLIGPGVLLLGVNQAFTYWHNRQKNYKLLSSNKVVQNSSIVTVNITTGAINANPWGLVLGYFVGQLVNISMLVKKANFKNFAIKYSEMIVVAKEYRNFPLYMTPMLLINTFSLNILVYLLALYFGTETVGQYSQAFKVSNYPLFLISSSFSIIFYQKLNEIENKQSFYLKSFFLSIFIGLLVLLPLVFWGKELFSFVLGRKWEEAGLYAAILIPHTVIAFAFTNISEVFSVLQKNQYFLIWQILYLIIIWLIVILFKSFGIETILFTYSIVSASLYLVLFYIGYVLLRKN